MDKNVRIIWKGSMDSLYRFLILFFNLNCDYGSSREYITPLINYYFITENNTELIVDENKFSIQKTNKRESNEKDKQQEPSIKTFLKYEKYFYSKLGDFGISL